MATAPTLSALDLAAERMRAAAVRAERRLLPPVCEPGSMPWLSLFYLAFPLMPALLPGFPQPDWRLTLLAIALFLPLYFGFYWLRGWRRIGVLSAMAALSAALVPANLFANTFLIYSNVLSAFLPVRWMLVFIAATQGALAYVTLHLLDFGDDGRLFVTLNLVTCLVATLCNRFWIATACKNQALRLSQEEVTRLAQLAERERISRDLHDLLGHTLSVIALKSELAVRLFDRDPAAARREVADVERVAREALGQVRRAVSGMRAMGLRAELASARLAMSAVMVDFEYRADDLRLHPEIETVLALSLREAATNVIRHAEARRCHASLAREGDDVVLEVHDDGIGGVAADGNGLRGMRERIAALAGTLTIESPPRQGTRLTLRLPFRAPPEPAEQGAPPPRKLALVR